MAGFTLHPSPFIPPDPLLSTKKEDTPRRSMTLNTAGTHSKASVPARALNIALWILQLLLAVAFLLHGWLMVAPPAELVAMINAQLGAGFRIFIGVAELLAGAGLVFSRVSPAPPLFSALGAAGGMVGLGGATA